MFRPLTLPRLTAGLAVIVSLLFTACQGNGTTGPQMGPLTIIVVTPNPNALAVGGSQQFVATGEDANGNVVSLPQAATWAVVAGGGSISGSGLFTAGASAGTFANTIEATSGGVSGFASVSITSGTLATISVTPNPVSVATGADLQFTATGRDASGNIVPISPAWSVVNATAGAISSSGQFTAGTTAGRYTKTVVATSGTVADSATVTVLAIPGPLASITITPNPASMAASATQQFTASGRDANGVVIPISPAPTWSVVNGGGTINSGSGLFTAGITAATFTNTIKATSGAVSAVATVTVVATAGPLASITITPNPASVAANATQQFTASGQDANGVVVVIAPAPTWSVVNSGGTINSGSGQFTAGASAGSFPNTIKASSGGISGFASVTVTVVTPPPGPLASITIAPNPASIAGNATQEFSASGRDANGVVVPISPALTWSVVNATAGAISSTGLFTAGTTAGTYTKTVVATSGAIADSATVTVVVAPGPLASITISPNPATMEVNATQQFTASGQDANGVVIPISPAPTWSVVNGGGTINSGSGLFTAGTTAATFTNTIKATSGGISGFAAVTVTVAAPGPLASITITPNPASVAATATQQFTASGQDANGVVIPIKPAPTWSVVNGGGTINSGSGLFTAGASAASFPNTVKAASGGISGFASVTVTSSGSGAPSLGTASAFAVLGSTAVSCTGVSNIAGSVGVAPAGAVTGFPTPCTISAPGAATPHVNDAVAKTAQADVTPAYNALAAMACGTALTGQDLGGKTLAPGVYCFTSSAQLTGILTLAGPANGLWVFQVASALTTGTSAQVVLIGGAQAKNVFWQIGSSATIGQTTAFQGNIIAAVSVTLVQGASLHGRALSKAGVTMDTNIITLP